MGVVKVIVEGKERKVEIGEGKKVEEIMRELGLILDEYVPVLNGEVVTELEKVRPGDKLEFVRVWSGG